MQPLRPYGDAPSPECAESYSDKFRRFPMFVVPVAYLLERMARFEMHEDLMARGDLVEYTPGMGPVTFVSHTWLSHQHPDPRGEKLSLLKSFLRGALDGKVTVKGWWFEHFLFGNKTISADVLQSKVRGGYCWVDFCSVPQRHGEDQQNAVISIPSYVADSAIFVCVAPPSRHQDTGQVNDVRALKRRGWCRMERISNELSPEPKKCIVLESPSSQYVAMSRDWLFNPVGLAEFHFDRDKDLLGPVILDMLTQRQAAHLAHGNLHSYRLLASMKANLLEGCAVQQQVLDWVTYEDWMDKMHFTGPHDDAASGWTPLRFALYEGQIAVAKELLRRGVDPRAPLGESSPGAGYHFRGCTILHGLSFLRDAPEEIELLLSARASLWDRDEHGNTALHLAFGGGRCANIRTIMRIDPSVAGAFDFHGYPVMNHAVVTGYKEAFASFSKQYPEHAFKPSHENELGQGFVALAVCDAGDYDTVLELLNSGYAVDMPCTHNIRDNVKPALCRAMQLICYLSPSPDCYVEWLANLPHRTALMDACYFGNLRVVELLLERRASLSKVNCYNRTPLHFAAMQGHQNVVSALLVAGACPDARDTWGRTPADWAQLRAHTEVADLIRTFQMPFLARATRNVVSI